MEFVPKAERRAWHEKALDAAEGGDLHSLLELLIETRETIRLADLVRRSKDDALEKVSHDVTEPAATRLETRYPDLAARLWRAQAMRIVNAGKSNYYFAALSNFERARDCYRRAGLGTEWEQTVSMVCAEHSRKTGLMPGFQALALAAGARQRDEPCFLERAKARRQWKAKGE